MFNSRKILLLTLLFTLALTLVACGSDDENEPIATATAIALLEDQEEAAEADAEAAAENAEQEVEEAGEAIEDAAAESADAVEAEVAEEAAEAEEAVDDAAAAVEAEVVEEAAEAEEAVEEAGAEVAEEAAEAEEAVDDAAAAVEAEVAEEAAEAEEAVEEAGAEVAEEAAQAEEAVEEAGAEVAEEVAQAEEAVEGAVEEAGAEVAEEAAQAEEAVEDAAAAAEAEVAEEVAEAEEALESVDLDMEALEADTRYMEGDRLIGEPLLSVAGDSIGEIADAVIDTTSGKILFITVEFGGFLGFNEEVIPVPLSAVTWDPMTTRLTADLDESAIEGIEAFPEGWPEGSEAGWYASGTALLESIGVDVSGLNDASEANAVLLTELINRGISNSTGDELGEMDDVLLDMDSGTVALTVVSFGGFLGLGESDYPVPFQAFTFQPSQDGDLDGNLILDITAEDLESAPIYDLSSYNFGDPNWNRDIRNYWSERGVEFDEMSMDDDMVADEMDEIDINTVTPIFVPGTMAIHISDLVGASVSSTTGEELGTIEDLLINLQTGNVIYVALTRDGMMEMGDAADMTGTTEMTDTAEMDSDSTMMSGHWIPIPASALLRSAEDTFVLNADGVSVDGAPTMDRTEWPMGISDPLLEEDVYGYWADVTELPLTPLADITAGTGPYGTFRGLPSRLFRASDALGMPIMDRTNESTVATLDDMIFAQGQLRYAVLTLANGSDMEMESSEEMTSTVDVDASSAMTETDGVSDETMGMSGAHTIVPLSVLLYNHETNTFLVDMDVDNLQEAPSVMASDFDLADPDWDADFNEYWEENESYGLPGVRMMLSSLILGETLIGYEVLGTDGEDLGEISDFVIDSDSGKVRYAVIEFGGFLGLGEELFFIPLDQLSISMISGSLTADLVEEDLENAPSIGEGDWPDLNTEEWDVDIRNFWNIDVDVTADDVDVEASETMTDSTDTMMTGFNDLGGAFRATDLLEADLISAGDEEYGVLEDMVIDLFESRVLYVVVETGGVLEFDEEYIVPFDRVSLTDTEEGMVRIDVDAADFDGAPVFDLNLFGASTIPSFRTEVDNFWSGSVENE